MATAKGNPARVGVVVLAYGGERQHESLLESLAGEGIDPGAILVVHNQAAAGEPPPPVPAGIELVQSDRNRGYAGG